jgi:hypothetical protein
MANKNLCAMRFLMAKAEKEFSANSGKEQHGGFYGPRITLCQRD